MIFSDDSGMLFRTNFCRAPNPASLSVFGRVSGKNSTDGENQQSRGTSYFLMILGCGRERVFAAHPTLQALVFLVGCAAKTLPMVKINDLEEHRVCLMILGCVRERVFAAHPTLQALVFLVGCAAKTLPMAKINDLEEHCIF